MFGIPPCLSGEAEAWRSRRDGHGPRGHRTGGEAFWAQGMASGGLSFLLGEAASLFQARPSWSRKTCLLPPPGARPECGLFILGLSCRHSSTFFHRSGCPSPAHVSRPLPLPEAPKLGGGGGVGVVFQPKVPCLSPLVSVVTCLHISVSLPTSQTLHLWAHASVSLTPELRALVFQRLPCPDSLRGLSPPLLWQLHLASIKQA